MAVESLETDFGNDWGKFGDVLRRTNPQVIEAFRETSLENNFEQWYGWAVPRIWELPIDFLLRNSKLSFAPDSLGDARELEIHNRLMRFGYFLDNIPFLGKFMGVNKMWTELYLGQRADGYISQIGETRGSDDRKTYTVVTSNRVPTNLNIEVGFIRPKIGGERDWFYRINVVNRGLLPAAQQAHDIIKKATGGVNRQ